MTLRPPTGPSACRTNGGTWRQIRPSEVPHAQSVRHSRQPVPVHPRRPGGALDPQHPAVVVLDTLRRSHPAARANRKRFLPAADPRARGLTISCGAALFNLRMAIRAAGHEPVVRLVPDDNDPDLLARVEVMASNWQPAAAERRLWEAIPRRHTNREAFTGRACR